MSTYAVPSDAKPKRTRSSKSSDYSADFLTFWNLYPARLGSNSKAGAFIVWQANIKAGVLPDAMIDGARRYAARMDAEARKNPQEGTGTSFVMQSTRFLGREKHYESPYSEDPALDARKANGMAAYKRMMEIAAERGLP